MDHEECIQRIDRRSALERMVAAIWAAGTVGGGLSGVGAANTEDATATVATPPLDDARLGPLLDLDGYFPFRVSATPEAWAKRAVDLRRRILVSTGLWPMPTRDPIRATIHGTVERDGYTVERVFFESSPGLFVTGSLYRPTGKSGRLPAVLSPHGHWANGRFHDHGEAAVRREVETGAEKSLVGGRHPLQARCVHLARMGCVVFHYDMLGYADSAPIGPVAHNHARERPQLSSPERFGLFSAQAELRLLNALGLQTWNSIRAFDWLASLSYVDAGRIAVTGASGGGTQTFILCAIDTRPAVSFPAVMVSTAMQGGCTCENASYLRVGTGNVEMAALFAPKPLGLTAANDWTREMPEKGLPELHAHWALLGAADKVSGKYFAFDHNYNAVSREYMYGFVKTQLGLDGSVPIEESEYVPLSRSELTVWSAEHPKPRCEDDDEAAVLRWFASDADKEIERLVPRRPEDLPRYREVVGGGFEVMIGRHAPKAAEVLREERESRETSTQRVSRGYLRIEARGETVPIVIFYPTNWRGGFVLWPDDSGKAHLETGGSLRPAAARMLAAGFAVVGIDTFLQGEFLADASAPKEARRVANPREFAGYTLGYNHPLAAQRTHDIQSALAWLDGQSAGGADVRVVARGRAAVWAAAALLERPASLRRAVLDTAGYRLGGVSSVKDPDLWPGALKYGDVPGLLSLLAPLGLVVIGETSDSIERVARTYRAAGADGALRLEPRVESDDRLAELVLAAG
jgi:dienelactone hydrolase